MFGLGRNLPEKVQAQNREVFALGRETGRKMLEG
jgi:hypothetical protein